MKNTEVYDIVKDEQVLKSFIDWLPDLQDGEVYYCCLFARNKYTDKISISSGQTQLKRFVSKKDFLFSKISQLQSPIGSYTYKGEPIPEEALALYINPNPRSLFKATKNSLKKFADIITDYKFNNPNSEVMSQLQVAHSRKVFMDFDFDDANLKDVIQNISDNNLINIDCLRVLLTRGGFHLLTEVSKINNEHQKTWYNSITNLPGLDMKGDGIMPVPGCTQGNYIPTLITDLKLLEKLF